MRLAFGMHVRLTNGVVVQIYYRAYPSEVEAWKGSTIPDRCEVVVFAYEIETEVCADCGATIQEGVHA